MNMDEAIKEVQQPRSRYQLIHFVLGQHDTPEMRFYQLCLELQDMRNKLRLAKLSERRVKIEIERLLATGDEIDAIDAEEKEGDLKDLAIVIGGAEKEFAILTDLFNESQKYSRDEIEHAQPEYWQQRLTRQTNLQIMSGNVGWAQLDSMRQIGLLDEMINEREQAIAAQAQMELRP